MLNRKGYSAMNSNKDILVSVIIPVYNAERYLKGCLDSVLNQTYKNIEVICVNDGSTDRSLDILNLYQKRDARLKVISQKNAGPSAARNCALDHATGDYISFVDADDILQYNAYEILVECANQEQNWDIVMFGGNVIGEGNDYISYKLNAEFKQYVACEPNEVIFSEKTARPFLWLHFIKRELIEKPTKLRFDESLNLGEDQIFQFGYVPRAKNVMVIDQKLYNYRIEKNASLMNLYNNQRIKKTNCHFMIVEKVVEEWKKIGHFDLYKDALYDWAINFIYYTVFEFPSEFKKEYAERFIAMCDKFGFEEYLVSEYEYGHLMEIKEWSLNDMREEEELKNLAEMIKQEKHEIDETLKSRAFKLGTKLTKKKDRLVF